ncbi:MAG: SDR family oxidoreductase, partial [Campylobacter sp.]
MKNLGTAFITGATSGFGEAIARALSAQGYKIIALGRRKERLQKLAGELGNTLTGFNFADGSGTSLKITEHKDGTGSSVAMDNLTLSGDKKSFTFTV